MAGPEGGTAVELTEAEKKAARERKAAKKAAKRAELSPEALAKAEARRVRIAERVEAKKKRAAEAKASRVATEKKRPSTDDDSSITTLSRSNKAKKAKRKAATEALETTSGSHSKAIKTARLAEQNKRHQINIAELRAKRLAETADMKFEPPYEVFLKYLPPDVTAEQVAQHFDGCGEIVPPGPRLGRDGVSGKVIRGFVTFSKAIGLRNALARDLERIVTKEGSRSISVTKATGTGTMQAEGTHTPAMFADCVRQMGVHANPNGVFIDGTFGRGGHTRKILEALGPKGELHAFDMDEEAVKFGRALEHEDQRFHMHHACFSEMVRTLMDWTGRKVGAFVDGILIDIGISSPQLDGARGFRPEFDGPLDMRFDVRPEVESALQYLHRVDRKELALAIQHYGGEHPLAARRIADAVALAKLSGTLPERTGAFGALVARAKGLEYQAMHPAKMTFQALRIVVNREYDELRAVLVAGLDLLRAGGKITIITWKHSECAIVVDFSRKHEIASSDTPLWCWYDRAIQSKTIKPAASRSGIVVEPALRPSPEEVRMNSRSRSAVLHVLRKEVGVMMSDIEALAMPVLGWAPYPTEPIVFTPTVKRHANKN